MADVNTTDSTLTPTETPPVDPNPATGSDNTSTTESPQTGEDDAGSTLLTGGEQPEGEQPAGEQPEGEQPEPTEEEKARAALFGAPEGDYEITGLPEGMDIDKEALEAVTPLAKELGLSNEGFSKLAGVYAEKVLPGVQDRIVDGIQQDVAATHAQWASEALEMIQTDETFGGQKLNDVKAISAKALDRFGGADFRNFLDSTGLGNHPAMIKFAYLAGTLLSEDTSFERGGTAPAKKTAVEKFYGPQG